MEPEGVLMLNPITGETFRVLVTEEELEMVNSDAEYAAEFVKRGVVAEDMPRTTQESQPVSPADAVHNIDVEVAEEKNNNIHIWQYDETLALIHSMETHIEDLSHPTKKKHVYQNIANDLISLKHNVSATMCANKWKTLLRSYKSAKDNKNKTGRGPSRFLFFEQIDSLLGDKPSNSCHHVADSSRPTVIENEEPIPPIQNKLKRKRGTERILELSEKEINKERRHKEKLDVMVKTMELEEKKIALLEKLINK